MLRRLIRVLLFGILDGARVFSAWIVVTNGAREGARAAAVRNPEFVVLDRIDQAMGGVNTYNTTLTNVQGVSGSPVTVGVDSDVTIVTPLIANIFGGGIVNVSSTATMQLE
jgi:Flp pilus assembly protein TadG